MSSKPKPKAADRASARRSKTKPDLRFDPVPVRPRVDGWTAERQVAFLQAFAATGNVEAACRTVGMSTSSVYTLRARRDAGAFRDAWRTALDMAVARAADAALERAIAGEVTPIFYKGEQVGERRRFDNRMTMFLLRTRDPARFGTWRDGRVPDGSADAAAHCFHLALARTEIAALDQDAGDTPLRTVPLPEVRLLHPAEEKVMLVVKAQLAAEAEERRQAAANDPEVDTEGGT